MRLQILGMGCQKCAVLSERVEQAARELGIDYELQKVTDAEQIARFGVMSTPALAVDGVVHFTGRVPTVSALREILWSVATPRV